MSVIRQFSMVFWVYISKRFSSGEKYQFFALLLSNICFVSLCCGSFVTWCLNFIWRLSLTKMDPIEDPLDPGTWTNGQRNPPVQKYPAWTKRSQPRHSPVWTPNSGLRTRSQYRLSALVVWRVGTVRQEDGSSKTEDGKILQQRHTHPSAALCWHCCGSE